MKIRNVMLSKRTLILGICAILLFCSGGIMGTRASLTIFSQDYNAQFELDHLQIHLLENGQDVCGGHNTLENKVSSNLLEYLGWDGTKPGTFEPGRVYKEEIAALNGRDVPQYVRLSIRKYWRTADGKKDSTMDPGLIELAYGKKAYNDAAWVINDEETTTESKTYYYRTTLAGEATSEPVVDSLRISDKLVAQENIIVEKKGNIITYTYKYNDYIACLEADVQSLQHHNANDAIESLWGVTNVTAANGVLTVENAASSTADGVLTEEGADSSTTDPAQQADQTESTEPANAADDDQQEEGTQQ